MSKSKGPLLTLRQAVAENGADVTRLYILGNAEGHCRMWTGEMMA